MGIDLAWFADTTAYDYCAMFGFSNGPDARDLGCSHVWSEQDRKLMQAYLEGAKNRVENFLGYPLTPRFICDERHKWNKYGLIGPLKFGYIQKFGTKTESTVGTVAGLSLASDIVTFTITVDFTDTCEARIFHTTAKGGEEIFPLTKSISGTTLTVTIRKCALVDPDAVITPHRNDLDYEDNANFVTSVVVKRIYAEPGTGATIIWNPSLCSCTVACVMEEQSACALIQQKRISTALISPASYSAGVWTAEPLTDCLHNPSFVDVDYVAYYDEDCEDCDEIPLEVRWAIIHIALADMPRSVCGCDIHDATFKEDSQFPRDLPAFNPFGIKVGHIIAYNLLKFSGVGSGGLLVAT